MADVILTSNERTEVERLRDTVEQLRQEIGRLKAESRHSHETCEPRCSTYWRIHANRCVRPKNHEGACYYHAPGYAIEIGEQFAFEPPPDVLRSSQKAFSGETLPENKHE